MANRKRKETLQTLGGMLGAHRLYGTELPAGFYTDLSVAQIIDRIERVMEQNEVKRLPEDEIHKITVVMRGETVA